MRPDLEEYEELNVEEDAPRGRAISWLVLGVAVIGFGALAYYAYQSGSKSAADGQMLVVEAEPGPIKEAPADPGGEQFPHKDKTIYDALSTYRSDEQAEEKLLPEPEEPVMPEPAVNAAAPATKTPDASSFVNVDEGVGEADEASEKTANDAAAAPIDRTIPAPVAKPLDAKPAANEKPNAPASTAMAEKAPEKSQPVTPKPVESSAAVETEKPTAPVAPAAKPTVEEPVVKSEKPAAKPAAAPAAKPAAPAAAGPTGGDYKIQLGAYGSDGEARQMWSKITAKSGDVVKGSPIIVKADVNGKTYYRLRATGFASADAAKRACAMLSGRGQGCFSAGK